MKKQIIASVILTALLSANVFGSPIIINNKKIDAQAIIVDNRALVPVRGVFENLNFNVEWDNAEKKASLSDGNTTITIKNGEKTFTANGKEVVPDVPQRIINGSFYLPLRSIVELLPDYEIEWNSDEKRVYIKQASSKKPAKESNNSLDSSKEKTETPKLSGNSSSSSNSSSGGEKNKFSMSNDGSGKIESYEPNQYKNDVDLSDDNTYDTELDDNTLDEIEKEILDLLNEGGNNEVYEFEIDDDNAEETGPDAGSIADLEKEVFNLVNEERSKAGASPLEWSDELADVARAHSADMAENDYFSSSTAEAVMNQWMNSEGHRKNILNPDLRKLGVGLAFNSDSEYGYYWTQCFTG